MARAARRRAPRSPAFVVSAKCRSSAGTPITVPGAVHAWSTLWRRFGSRPFADLLEPAIAYARHGFPVAPVIAAHWSEQAPRFQRFREFARVFLPRGRAPAPGEIFRNPELAASLEEIAATEGGSLYTGPLAVRIADASAAGACAASADDLGEHQSTWVEPLVARARAQRRPRAAAQRTGAGVAGRAGNPRAPAAAARLAVRQRRSRSPAGRVHEARVRHLPAPRRRSRGGGDATRTRYSSPPTWIRWRAR